MQPGENPILKEYLLGVEVVTAGVDGVMGEGIIGGEV